jgi:hypothetical protein
MKDNRDVILNSEYNKWICEKGVSSIYPPNFPAAYKDAAINAMDEYMKECCLELIQYMCDNNLFSTCRKGGIDLFYHKGEWINKEQLFENFL